MFKRLEQFAPQILGITRILFGVLMACHGAQKVVGVFGGMPAGAPKAIVWTGGPIELLCGVLVAIGFSTRPATFILSGLMAFAYFMGHAPNGFWPKRQGGELAVVYCWLALYFAAQGPGAWAVDRIRATTPRVLYDSAS